MRVLFIGGTGNISAACSRLCVERGLDVYVLNRGQREMPIPGVSSKIKQFVPDYVAGIPFHVGVRKTLAWFEADPKRQRIVTETNETMDRYIAEWRRVRGAGG